MSKLAKSGACTIDISFKCLQIGLGGPTPILLHICYYFAKKL